MEIEKIIMFKEEVAVRYKQIQDEICRGLEIADGKGTFEEEIWERNGGGGGRTRIMQNGAISQSACDIAIRVGAMECSTRR